MPLKKLWNTIRGRSAENPRARVASDETAATEPAAVPKPQRSSRKGIFGGRSPHASLCKQLKGVSATKVLEISVDDGSRAIAVLQTLAKNDADVRYAAIDQFEMAGGPTTLMQFHQRLRESDIRPQVFPESIQRGLVRVAHTIGSVDLIVIGAAADQWQTPAVETLLSRVSHQATVVLYRSGDGWLPYKIDSVQGRRAA